jgi:prepilin-type N-terminal cleavage/methylation domain-containing protein
MRITVRRKRECGFTLVEMLAALVAAVVVIGAATGFVLTAAIREFKVLGANALEARHESLAEAMLVSIKSATAFQIYPTDPGIKFGSSLTPGKSTGNLLVCVRADLGLEEEFLLSGNQIVYTQLDGGPPRAKYFDYVSTSGGVPLFDTNLGIIQAHWNVITSLDLVPFSVYGLPLRMQ